MKENRGKSIFTKNKNIIIIFGTVITVLILAIILYIFSINSKVKAWEDRIYPGVNVYGIDLGGLNKDEATDILNEKLSFLIMDKKLWVLVDDKKIKLSYVEISPQYDINTIVKEAFNYGKDGDLFSKNSIISNKDIINIDVKVLFDEEALKTFEEKVKEEVNIKAKNAKIQIESGNILIIPEVYGKRIDEYELHNRLIEGINGGMQNVVELIFKLKEEEAKIKTNDLSKITGKISGYSSRYKNTNDGRIKNMQIASESVNGTLLMPGEEFSYNNLIGGTTPDKGYEKANTYVGNKIVPDYGGGICQISTTLYRAAMRANLRSTERMNHSLTVSYSEPGLDATVANGVIDYKFKNTYDFPIYIEGYVGGGLVTFNIYGNVDGMDGKSYDLVNEINEKYNPQVKYKDNPTMDEGTEKVEVYGMPGYKATSYQVTYQNGVEVNREFISTDVYMTTDTVIQMGTRKNTKEESKKDERKNQENTNTTEDIKLNE